MLAGSHLHEVPLSGMSWYSRLVLKCGLAHLNANANARDESNANANANASAQHLNQMQMQMRSS